MHSSMSSRNKSLCSFLVMVLKMKHRGGVELLEMALFPRWATVLPPFYVAPNH